MPGHPQDIRLARRHRAGDLAAREALIARYLPRTRALARRYAGGPEPLDDLVQVASLGLVNAVDRWRPDQGAAFWTFAEPTILGELRRHFRNHTWAVRPPRALQELGAATEAARDRLGVLGREPTITQIADYLGRKREQVEAAVQATQARGATSLDAPAHAGQEESLTVSDVLGADDPAYEQIESRATLASTMCVLDSRTREIVRLRFDEGRTQVDIAERIGLSQVHVSRIISSALNRMRHYVENDPIAA